VVGLGRLAAEGDLVLLKILRQHASDPRWRIREAVAMALHRLGRKDDGKMVLKQRQGYNLDYEAESEQEAACAYGC
jgi:hypothetical protein